MTAGAGVARGAGRATMPLTKRGRGRRATRGNVDHRLLQLKGRGRPSRLQETRDILLTKEGVRKHRRRGKHGSLGDIAKVSRQVRQVELTVTVAEKRGVGSGNLSLMGEALGKRRD